MDRDTGGMEYGERETGGQSMGRGTETAWRGRMRLSMEQERARGESTECERRGTEYDR